MSIYLKINLKVGVTFLYNYSMEFFDGKKHVELLDEKVRKHLSSNLIDKPLAIVLIGDDPASEKYVGIKQELDILEQVERIFNSSGAGEGII